MIADEVCDISNKEQFSICLRYVHDKAVKEMFLDFVEVERIKGYVLATALLRCLSDWGLSYVDMRGQCYDGSTNMVLKMDANLLYRSMLQWLHILIVLHID